MISAMKKTASSLSSGGMTTALSQSPQMYMAFILLKRLNDGRLHRKRPSKSISQHYDNKMGGTDRMDQNVGCYRICI